MPAKWERCVKKVKTKSKGKVNAWAVCTKSTGLHGGGKKKRGAALLWLVALIALSALAFAGERSYTCTVGPCTHQGAHAPIPWTSAECTDFDSVTYDNVSADHCYPIDVPIWRGPNDDGLGLMQLRYVRVTMTCNPAVYWGWENTSNQPVFGAMQYDIATFCYFSHHEWYWHNPWVDGPYERANIWGGESIWYSGAFNGCGAFDGTLDGYGLSGRSGVGVGTPPPINVNTPGGMQYYPTYLLRPWTVASGGAGLHRFYAAPRGWISGSGAYPSHWRGWSEYYLRPASTVTVTYVWE